MTSSNFAQLIRDECPETLPTARVFFRLLRDRVPDLHFADGSYPHNSEEWSFLFDELAELLKPPCPVCTHVHEGEPECAKYLGENLGFCQCRGKRREAKAA